MRPLTVLFMKIFLIRKVYGLERVPKKGPVILAANHSSYLDFLIVPSIVKRRVKIIAAKELTKHPVLGIFAGYDGCILLDRQNPSPSFFKECLATLKNNGILLVFPEGTRSLDGEVHEWKPAFVDLAIRTDAAIIPIAINGTYEALPKNGKLKIGKFCDVFFGKAETLSKQEHYSDAEILKICQNVRENVMKELAKLRA